MLPRQAKSGGYKYGRVSGDAPFAEAMDSVAASAATPDFSSQGLAIGKKKGRRPKKTSQDDESKPNPKPTSKRSVEVDTHGPSEPSAGSAPKKRRNGSKGKKVTEEPLPQLSFLFFSVGVCLNEMIWSNLKLPKSTFPELSGGNGEEHGWGKHCRGALQETCFMSTPLGKW